METFLARVVGGRREPGARVKFNAYLRDMNLGVPGNHERRLRSALGASKEPQRGAAEEDGSMLVPREGGPERRRPRSWSC